jgi:pimeloyl-ACP methyl ester carboxylesterase
MEAIDNIIIESTHNRRKMLGDVRFQSTGTQKPVILFVHGFKGFKDWGHFNLIANWFAENGFVYCKFNLSHNGTTVQDPVNFVDLEAFGNNNFSIELNDLGSIIDYITGPEIAVPESEVNKKMLFMIGHSRGGGLTILKAAEDPRIKAIATWAAIGDVTKMWPGEIIQQWEKDGVYHVLNSRTGQNMPLYYQLVTDFKKHKSRLDIPKAASKLNCPWLICHGTEDETVPFSMGLNLKSKNKKSESFMIEGASHTFGGAHPYDSIRLLKHARLLIGKTREFFESNF